MSILLAVVALGGAGLATPASAQRYDVVDLGTLTVPWGATHGINNLGQVVGSAWTASGYHAFLWQGGAMTDLGALGGNSSLAHGINDLGRVVGWAETGDGKWHAFLWDEDEINRMRDLGTLGGNSSVAHGINNLGQVVGWAEPGAYDPYHAFLWQGGAMTDLGTLAGSTWSQAYGINISGQVVGRAWEPGGPLAFNRAFLWDASSGMSDLGTLGGKYSQARGINNLGQVVGSATTADGKWHAFQWDASSGMSDLGILGTETQALGINNLGQVVGYVQITEMSGSERALLWEKGVMKDLNDLIPPGSGWVLGSAYAINDAGEIVGSGVYNGQSRAFLLIPSHTPVATDDAYSVNEDTVLDVGAPGVLGNDTDPDGDVLTALLVSGPASGTVDLNPDGSFTYRPTLNFSGTDSFIYKANDGATDSNLAVVTISVNQVNDAPVAQADGPYLGVAGVPLQMDASASDDPEGAPLTFTWAFGDGSAVVVTTDAVIQHTYTTAGTFAMTLVVNDGQLNSGLFTTTATIGVSAGGGREDVDAFLGYVSPAESRTDLPPGTTSFDVLIVYGRTIIPQTFQAFLDREPFTGFSPIPGTSETVPIPLSPGRNVLLLKVDGMRSDGRTATDQDRLTFIVP